MIGQTRLQRRGGIYYFRAKIPVDLQPAYANRKEIKFSLKTNDRREAARLCNLHAVEVDEEFRQKRQFIDGATNGQPLRRISRLDSKTIQQLANALLRESLETDEFLRLEGLYDTVHGEGVEQTTLDGLRQAVSSGNVEFMRNTTDAFLRLMGVKLDIRNEYDYKRVLYAFLQAMLRKEEVIAQRNRGEVVELEKVAPLAESYQAGAALTGQTSLFDLFELWAKAVDRPKKTISAYRATVDAFTELIGDKPAEDLKRADFIAFKDHLQKSLKLYYKTVENKLIHLTAILNHAVANEKLESHAATLLKVSKPNAPVKRCPYDHHDLRKIFSSPLYLLQDRPKGGGGEAAVWLPVLALYTGARLEELGQLQVKNIEKDSTGADYINVTDADDEQSVKTVSSRRKIPVHPELIRLGFLQYVAERKAARDKLLFPLIPDSHGKKTGNWSKWYGRYSRKVIGITDPLLVFHSFRHTFKDACRDAGLSEEKSDALTGHASGSVGRSYGSGHSVVSLAKAMPKIKFDGLKIPILCPLNGK
jgi:integrase